MVKEYGYTPASEYDGDDDDDDDDVIPFEKSCRRWPLGKISESHQYGRADATCNISCSGSGLPSDHRFLPCSLPTTYLPPSLLMIHIYSIPMVRCLHSTRRFGSSCDSSIIDIAFSVSEGSGRKWIRVSRDVRCVGDSSQPRQCALNESAVARCIHVRLSNQSRQ